MSVVTLFQYPNEVLSSKPLITFLGQIKQGKYANSVDRLRELYNRNLDTLFDQQKRQIPRFSVAGNFKVESENLEIISYSNCLFFEIKYLRPDEMENVRALLNESPYIYSCFKNTLGLGLCFIVKTDVVKELHQNIYQKVHRYFEKKLNTSRMQKAGKDIEHLCMMSYDSNTTINAASIPFPYYETPKH